MTPDITCDVLVIGAGIAGAWAAKQLCEAGLSVVLVEAGPEMKPGSGSPLNKSTAARQAVQSMHPAYWMHSPEHFVDDVDNPYVSAGAERFVWIRGRQVGGRSLTWGGATLRFSDHELRPQDSDPSGWPISYEDLAPSYALVEKFLDVRGSCDAVPTLPDGVFAPPAPLTQEESLFKQHVESRWSDRRVVNCRGIVAGDSLSSGDSRWPSLTVQHRVLPAAMKTGRLQLRPDTIVSHLITSPETGHVIGASCVDRLTAERVTLRGRVVALCASTIESVRILLNSRSPVAPNGLGNSSDCLGRFLLDHGASVLLGRLPGRAPHERLASGGAHGVLIPRFRNCGTPYPDFIRGYGVWGNMGRAAWDDTGERLWILCAMLEVLARRENRVTLDEARVDRWGIPVARIEFGYSRNERVMREDAEGCMREMVSSLGWHIEEQIRMLPGQFVHELGGVRMGSSPKTSVLNARNQSWEAPNLFVLDGSCFSTSGWQNPTLTIMALVVRACPFIVEGIRRNEFP